jgi:hypothetical protein
VERRATRPSTLRTSDRRQIQSQNLARRAGNLVLLIVTTALGGCSFTMNVAPSDPSERTRQAARECTSSVYYPALDTLAAAVGAANIVISATADRKVLIYGAETDKDVGLGLGITQLVLYGGAAAYGYLQLARCSTLRSEQNIDGDERRSEAAGRGGVVLPRRGAEEQPEPSFGGEDSLPSWSAFRRHPIVEDYRKPTRTEPP